FPTRRSSDLFFIRVPLNTFEGGTSLCRRLSRPLRFFSPLRLEVLENLVCSLMKLAKRDHGGNGTFAISRWVLQNNTSKQTQHIIELFRCKNHAPQNLVLMIKVETMPSIQPYAPSAPRVSAML